MYNIVGVHVETNFGNLRIITLPIKIRS